MISMQHQHNQTPLVQRCGRKFSEATVHQQILIIMLCFMFALVTIEMDEIKFQRRRTGEGNLEKEETGSMDFYSASLSTYNENTNTTETVGEYRGNEVRCKCLNCEEDKICGGIWKGNRYGHNGLGDLASKKIHIIVSHCKSDLDWIPKFVKGYKIESIHIISKCGHTVNGAPETATIEVLPNVGRCDHTYAYYINKVLGKKVKKGEEQDSIVFFLKDDISKENSPQRSGNIWNNFESLLQLASSDNGFGCRVAPGYLYGKDLSAYHDINALFAFVLPHYGINRKGYIRDRTRFQNPDYKSLGSWYTSLDAGPSPPVVQACYGGMFSASVVNIMKREKAVWSAVEKTLSRGNNIEEGHYAERSWAHLLSTPLQPFQVKALIAESKGVFRNDYFGAFYVSKKEPNEQLHL